MESVGGVAVVGTWTDAVFAGLGWGTLLAAVAGMLAASCVIQLWQELFRKEVPGPFQLPFAKNLLLALQMANTETYAEQVRFMKEHGATFTVQLPLEPRVVATTDPAVVEHILSREKKFRNYVKGRAWYERFEELLGDGIFNVDGDEWAIQRKTASHMFPVRSLRDDMSTVFRAHGRDVVALLDNVAATGRTIDMQDLFFKFTFDSIGEIAFGVNLGSLHSDDVPFQKAFDTAQHAVNFRFVFPGWRLRRFLGIGVEGQLARSIPVLNKFCADLLAERKKLSVEQLSERKDLLSRFMTTPVTTGAARHDDQYYRDIIMNFMIAGRDTTANLLSWATYCIAQHPEVRDRVEAEVDAVLGAASPGASGSSAGPAGDGPSYEQATKEMPFLHATCQETLRLYPSVPKDGKYAVADDVLPNGVKIRKGDLVAYLPYAMGRSERLWPNALDFMPERFLGEGSRPSHYKFTAFQAGPRRCLGMDMAYLEAQTLLAIIHQRYRFKVVPGSEITPERNITLRMKNGLPMTVTRR